MKILIPTSVDYDQLVSKLENRITKGDVIKDKVYYMLSRIHIYSEIYHYHKKRNYYRPIHDTTMKKIVGDRHYRMIKKLLLDNEIIECNNEYHISKPKPMSKGYRLTEKYNTGEVRWVTIPDNFMTEDQIQEQKHQDEINNQYDFILEMYNKYPLKVNPSVYDYLTNLKGELMKVSHNEFQETMVNNFVGRFVTYINKINDGKYDEQVSPSNHRISSTFTNFPKLIRRFITYNNKTLVGLDLSSSQPYILTSLLDSKFYTDTTDGFNLYTIYNDLYTTINFNIIYNNKSYSSSIMSGSSFTKDEIENLQLFKSESFERDFYSFVAENCDPEFNYTRNDVKREMMYYLFNDNKVHRKKFEGYKVMNSVFPALEKWITMAHKELGGGSNFSKLLQRAESYLLINQISRQFISLRPDAPLFTIHDGLYTTEEGVFILKELMKYHLQKNVGISPIIHIEQKSMDIEPTKKEIDKIMNEISKVQTQEDYNKVKGGILKVYVEKGEKI